MLITVIILMISNVSNKFQIYTLSYYQYDCSSMSTKETETNFGKFMEISFSCKSQFKAKKIDINLNYRIDDSKEKTEDSFLSHLFFVNDKKGKICIECLLLEDQKTFEVIKEDTESIQISRNTKYTLNSKEAQLLKVIKINLMEQHIFEDDWNLQILISKHSIIKVLSQMLFAFLVVLYEF